MELLAKSSFDAILLDQMMPRLDGYGVLQRLEGGIRCCRMCR